MMRKRLSGLLILILILGAAYAAIPWAARHLVEIWLADQGFSNPRFTISHPAWNAFEITEISLSQEDAERRIALDAGPILIRYHPARLLFNQQLTDIQIPAARLSLNYKPAIHADNSHAGELALLPLLPTRLIGLLPADRLLIGELAIQISTPQRPDWHFRGSLDLTSYQLQSRVHMRYGLEELGWSDIRFDNHDQFSLKMLYKDEAFINLEGDIQQDDKLTLNIDQQTHLARLRQWLSFIEPEIQSWPVFSGKVSSSGYLQLPLTLSFDDKHWLDQLKAKQQLITAIALTQPSPELSQVVIQSKQQLQLENSILSVTLQPTSQVKATPGITDIQLPPVTAKLIAPFTLDIPIRSLQQTATSSLQLALNAPPVRHKNMVLHSKQLQLSLAPFNAENNSLEGTITAPSLRISQPGQRWPELQFTNQFQLTPERLQNQFKISAPDTPLTLEGTASWHTDTSRADINWQLQPVGLKNIEHLIARYYPTLPAELQLKAGLLEHHGFGRWQNNQLNLTLRQTARDLRFNWDHLAGQQGFWHSVLRLQPDGSWHDKGRLRLGLLDAGLPVENIVGDYEIRHSRQGRLSATLSNTQFDLLGGHINFSTMHYNQTQDQFDTLLRVEQLQLAQILALEKQPGLSGDGLISGTLPLNYKHGQITITDGQLSSLKPGGFIRFKATPEIAAIASTNAGLNMALEALSDFRYKQLNIGVTYQADGTALLDTRLKGKNPGWNNGRPVNLGINVEENLPKLIQTLQITDQLTESLKKRYR